MNQYEQLRSRSRDNAKSFVRPVSYLRYQYTKPSYDNNGGEHARPKRDEHWYRQEVNFEHSVNGSHDNQDGNAISQMTHQIHAQTVRNHSPVSIQNLDSAELNLNPRAVSFSCIS